MSKQLASPAPPQTARERRNESIRAVADNMTCLNKYDLIAELLNAHGWGIGPDALANYASLARKK